MMNKAVAFLFMLITVTLSTDYCSDSICKKGEKHIACDNDGKFDKTCPSNVNIIEFTGDFKEFAINTQNKLRNRIALGEIVGYDKAARMATLVWHDELAKLAEYTVRTCIFEHDECHNTDNFPHAGQNIAIAKGGKKTIDPKEVIENTTKGWFDEHFNANKSIIANYKRNGKTIGHFTQLVQDQAYAVGCALVQFKKDAYTTIYACDYSLGNLKNIPVYEASSKTASKCTKGTNPQLKGLCSTSEIYDNKLFYN
ncbi:antigen 5 like allergen Cul n 1-like [Contarinia nasturtii]|uniref:antigen 5 like allergen Cul n 1-like n=1 Tax=Contarinia nasturtii TaxID=265458 RepID=UPI0012D3C980|nr:antigen 5 like allergen Cul n 1-like [Contarinia nasturtii]